MKKQKQSKGLPKGLSVFAVLNQNRWSLNRANDKLKYSLIGNGIWWISLPRETDYLKVSGAKETRQKREDVGFILLMLMEEEVMIQKQSRQLLGDRKFSNVIGWKKFTTFQVSMLRLFGTMEKKTYQLPGNSRNRGRIRVGELYKNSWRSFSFVSFIKKFFAEEQIKAHDDFFASRYNNATWKIFTRTVNKSSGWFSCSDAWWSKDMTLEFLTL